MTILGWPSIWYENDGSWRDNIVSTNSFLMAVNVMTLVGRVGKGVGEIDVAIRAWIGQQTEETRWTKGAHPAAAKGARGSGEEFDRPPWQEEGIAHPQTPRTWTVKHAALYLGLLFVGLACLSDVIIGPVSDVLWCVTWFGTTICWNYEKMTAGTHS